MVQAGLGIGITPEGSAAIYRMEVRRRSGWRAMGLRRTQRVCGVTRGVVGRGGIVPGALARKGVSDIRLKGSKVQLRVGSSIRGLGQTQHWQSPESFAAWESTDGQAHIKGSWVRPAPRSEVKD
ncbi:hypothetical protein D3C85_798520 [compost metagenome]